MMKVKYMLMANILLILSILFVLIPVSAADNEKESNVVTEMTARNVAQYYVNGYSKVIPAWTEGMVENPVAYYSGDEVISAYEFTVVNDSKPVGFIVISARKDWMPVLEFGDGRVPSDRLEKATEKAEETGLLNLGDTSEAEYYYSGATFYSV